MLVIVAWLASLRVRNYERGAPDDRRTTKKNAKRRFEDFRAGVWMQTLLRDPGAGIMHSCIYFGFIGLFMATVILEIDHQLPESLKFLHGSVYQAYAARRRPRRRRVPDRHRLGDRPPLHPAALPHPHQDQARGRGDPRHVPRHRRQRLPHRRRSHRAPGPARVREMVVRRLPDLGLGRHVVGHRAARRAPLAVGRARGRVPRVPRHPPGHEAAPHVHVTDEHVPEGPRAAQGRDEAHAEPHGDGSRVVRRREDRGLHVEAALRHRRVHGVRPLHVGVPRGTRPASRSTRARSC